MQTEVLEQAVHAVRNVEQLTQAPFPYYVYPLLHLQTLPDSWKRAAVLHAVHTVEDEQFTQPFINDEHRLHTDTLSAYPATLQDVHEVVEVQVPQAVRETLQSWHEAPLRAYPLTHPQVFPLRTKLFAVSQTVQTVVEEQFRQPGIREPHVLHWLLLRM